VALDQRRIRLGTQPTLVPRRNIFKPRCVAIPFTQHSVDLQRRAISPNKSFQKRRRSETVRAVHTRTTDLADRIQVSNRRTRPLVNQHATTEIMRRRNNRHWLARDIKPNLQTLVIYKWKALANLLGGHV